MLHGDTAVVPLGMDTYGSRSLAVGGVALYYAAERIVEKAKKIAAHLLGGRRGAGRARARHASRGRRRR